MVKANSNSSKVNMSSYNPFNLLRKTVGLPAKDKEGESTPDFKSKNRKESTEGPEYHPMMAGESADAAEKDTGPGR